LLNSKSSRIALLAEMAKIPVWRATPWRPSLSWRY